MSARSCAACCVGAVLLSLGAPRSGFAQRANGPYAGAFGAQPDVNRIEGLDLSALFIGAYDQNLLPPSTAPDPLDPRLLESGASSGISGSLTYERRADHARFSLTGGGTAREYASSRDLSAVAYQGSTSFSATVASRLVFDAGAGAQYSPFFQFAPFLGSISGAIGPPGPDFGFAAVAESNIGLDGSIGLTGNVTKQTSAFAQVAGRDWQMPDAPENNLRTLSARAGIRHNLTRSLGLHFEYGRDQTEYAFAAGTPYVNDIIDAGVDFGDTLAFSPHTAFSFSTSTMATRYLNETHYRLNGSARLTRGWSRTWSTWLGYNRNTEYRIGFREPLLSDSLDAGLSGLLSWRAKWAVDAGYTRGTIGFGSNQFSTYSGTTRFDFALTRTLAAIAQYLYYHYEVPPGSSTLDLLPQFSRQVATFGLSLSLPLVNHVRSQEPQEP